MQCSGIGKREVYEAIAKPRSCYLPIPAGLAIRNYLRHYLFYTTQFFKHTLNKLYKVL